MFYTAPNPFVTLKESFYKTAKRSTKIMVGKKYLKKKLFTAKILKQSYSRRCFAIFSSLIAGMSPFSKTIESKTSGSSVSGY